LKEISEEKRKGRREGREREREDDNDDVTITRRAFCRAHPGTTVTQAKKMPGARLQNARIHHGGGRRRDRRHRLERCSRQGR